MTHAETGQPVRLTVDNWFALVGLTVALIGAIVYHTGQTAKLAAIVQQHEARIVRIESAMPYRPADNRGRQ